MPVRPSRDSWPGEVVQVTSPSSAIVKIPRLVGATGGVKCRVAEGWWTPGEVTAAADGPDPHAHGIFRPLTEGDEVIVTFLAGRDELATITGRLVT